MKRIDLFRMAPVVLGLAVALTSCEKDTLDSPQTFEGTTPSVDLLANPNQAPQVITSTHLSTQAISGNNEIIQPVIIDATGTEWVHVTSGAAKTLYHPKGWVHVAAGANKSSYYYDGPTEHVTSGQYKTLQKPKGWEHKTQGDDKTSYGPADWKHIAEGENKTHYKPEGYSHITEGDNKTFYKKD